MHVCVYVCNVCMYVCVYVCAYVCNVCMYVCVYVCAYVCNACMYVCIYVCTYVCMYVCVCRYVMYVCMYVFTYVMYVCVYVRMWQRVVSKNLAVNCSCILSSTYNGHTADRGTQGRRVCLFRLCHFDDNWVNEHVDMVSDLFSCSLFRGLAVQGPELWQQCVQ
jgi:hypothetical protein